MKFRQLHHIVTLSETLSFSKAAQQVHLGQSAFSKSIANYEEQVGIRIFERTTNRVAVTALGQEFINYARQLLSETRNFDKTIAELKSGDLGSVLLGSGPYQARMFLEDVVRQFHAEYPKVSLTIRIDYWKNLLKQLHNSELNYFIADIRTLKTSERLKITPIGGLTLGIFCDRNHPLVVRDPARPIIPQELLPFTFASVSLPATVFSELKEAMGLNPNDVFTIDFQCDDLSFISRVVPDSDILFVASNRMMEEDINAGKIVKLNIDMRRNRFGEWALVQVKNRSFTPAASIMSHMLIENIRAGSLQDDQRYGLPDNKKLNFL